MKFFKLRIPIILFCCVLSTIIFSQTGFLLGKITEAAQPTEAIMFANIQIENTTNGTSTDLDGNFFFKELPIGNIQLRISYLGYKELLLDNINILENDTVVLNISLELAIGLLDEIEVVVSPLSKKEKTPVSIRTLSARDLKYSAGGKADVSQVLKSLPGINAPLASLANELMVRGGSSAENGFFIDGIEVPLISHLTYQGASGGGGSVLNLDLIQRSSVYTSSFPVEKGNAISGVFDFTLKEGNKKKLKTSLLLGATNADLVLDGPIGNNTTFIASARTLFSTTIKDLIKLPFVHHTYDWNIKVKTKLNTSKSLTFIGIGSRDKLNPFSKYTDTEERLANFELIAPYRQWFTSNAVKYNVIRDKSFFNLILSNSLFELKNFRYVNNALSGTEEDLLFRYKSREGTLNLTAENTWHINDFKFFIGGNLAHITYKTAEDLFLFNEFSLSNLHFQKWGMYVEASHRYFNRQLLVTLGARVDGNNFTNHLKNPFPQFSPRLAAAIAINSSTTINFSSGLYYQLPELIQLGFERNGEYLNKGLDYIGSYQLVGGIEKEWPKRKLNIEGFYKKYFKYPYDAVNDISVVNISNGLFRRTGNALVPEGKGRNYGMELYFEQQVINGVYSALSYSLLWSQYLDKNGNYGPSLTDNRHNISIRLGKHFNKNWHIGLKWQFQSGNSSTPLDLVRSAQIVNYEASLGNGVRDFSRTNEDRLNPFHTLDFRLDKKITYERFNLSFFLDISNILQNKLVFEPNLFAVRDENKQPIIDPDNPDSYLVKLLDNVINPFFPTFGIKLDFEPPN